MTKIKSRKKDHIDICMEMDVETGYTGFGDIRFVHRIPKFEKKEVSTKAKFLKWNFDYPFLISSMTGGCKEAVEINKNLAGAAQKFNIPLGLGSGRAAIDDPTLAKTYSIARETAPNAIILSNIGAHQLREYSASQITELIKIAKADGLFIHFNPLQEAIQPEGDTNFTGVFSEIKKLTSKLKIPVIAKETGAGFCSEDAKLLEKAGVAAIETAGWGGTNFALVEAYRRKDGIGRTFSEWGIPSLQSLIECIESVKIPIIASGGIHSGIDAAKAVALGASMAGFAKALLGSAVTSQRAVEQKLDCLANEFRISMFLSNSKNINQLQKARLYV
ncbi:type 2 isopentenyl-diphosphate Delta-isomerase [Candidatus Undinarchaeota archaeon]